MGLSSWHWGSWLQGETWGRQGTRVGCVATRVWVIRETATWANAILASRKGQQAAAVLVPGGSPGSCTLVKAEESGDTAYGTDLDPEEVRSRG